MFSDWSLILKREELLYIGLKLNYPVPGLQWHLNTSKTTSQDKNGRSPYKPSTLSLAGVLSWSVWTGCRYPGAGRAASVRRGPGCPVWDTARSSRPTTGHSWASQSRRWWLCNNVFKKQKKRCTAAAREDWEKSEKQPCRYQRQWSRRGEEVLQVLEERFPRNPQKRPQWSTFILKELPSVRETPCYFLPTSCWGGGVTDQAGWAPGSWPRPTHHHMAAF